MKHNIFAKSLMTNIIGSFARWDHPVATDPAQVDALSEMLAVSPETASLLLRRTGGCIQDAVNLWTGQASLPEISALPGTEEAVCRLEKAARSGEKVLVYSDFDADGISSAVILKEALELVGIHDVDVFFPCRFRDGYGFHAKLIDGFYNEGVSLIITADCGITGWDACEKAKRLGIDVIITDHHRTGPALPEALAIINPHLPSWEEFGLQDLTGAGVAYLLARAFLDEKGLADKIPPDWGTDMLTLSIAGDGHPVTGLNRTWIKQGLNLLEHTCRPGILALLCISGVFKFGQDLELPASRLDEPAGLGDWDEGVLGKLVETRDLEFERDVMYAVVPRINAAARLSHAWDAFDLLCENDLHKAFERARELDKLNRERRKIELAMLEECYERIAGIATGYRPDECREGVTHEGYPRYSICELGTSWHEGVVGIAASKVRDRHWRPCALIAGEGPVLKGSVRGIPGLNVHQALSECGELLLNYGGHAAAGGFSVHSENVQAFADKFEGVVKRLLGDRLIEAVLHLDDLLSVEDCSEEKLMPLVSLEPFGTGNPRPALGITGGKITGARLIGKGQDHLELTIAGNHNQVRLIWFGAGHKVSQVCFPGVCDLAFTPNRNTYLGQERVSLFVEDVRLPWGMLGSNYLSLARYISDSGPAIVYTWSSDAAASIWVGLRRLGAEAGLHLSGQEGALAHNARLVLEKNHGTVVSTAPWELVSGNPGREIRLLVVHPPVSGESLSSLMELLMSRGIKSTFLDRYVNDSITWLLARYPSKEYVEQVWKFLIGRPGNGKITVWEAGPLYTHGVVELEGAAYEQQLVLLESCLSIMMELDMISSDVINRIPMFVLHMPKGQVSLSGSPLYVKGRRIRKAAGQFMERFEGGIKHGGKHRKTNNVEY
jgi:single-stranded DNA-specific DHH superfamily exonuclease